MSRFYRLHAEAPWRLVMTSVAALAIACGPEIDDEDPPPGVLEYEHPEDRFYRLDRRVDSVPVDPEYSTRECGFFTDRAYDDLITTIEALDPTVDYSDFPTTRCRNSNPQGRVHLEGFGHSPFVCDWDCCHPDLSRVALVYFLLENAFVDIEFTIDDEDEPYIALEPDRRCE